MTGSTISLTAPDGTTLSAYRAEPDGGTSGAKGGVVVIQEIFGVNGHIRDVADRFAAEGWLAVAPALFDRFETGVELGYDKAGMEKGVGLAWNAEPAQVVRDIAVAVDAAAAAGRVGVVGFCWGGMLAARCAIELADRSPNSVSAAVGYYPSRTAQLLLDRTPTAPLMLQVGAHDQGIPLSDVDKIEAAWPDVTVHRYDAGHGFNCDRRESFAPEPSAQAWRRTLNFSERELARPT